MRDEPFDTFRGKFEARPWASFKALRRWLGDRTELDKEQVAWILTILGYSFTIETTPEMERQILGELAEREDIALRDAGNMQKMVGHRLNRHGLRELVPAYPEMSWAELQERFGLVMPTVMRSSDHFTRSHLRKHGHDLAPLQPACSGCRDDGL